MTFITLRDSRPTTRRRSTNHFHTHARIIGIGIWYAVVATVSVTDYRVPPRMVLMSGTRWTSWYFVRLLFFIFFLSIRFSMSCYNPYCTEYLPIYYVNLTLSIRFRQTTYGQDRYRWNRMYHDCLQLDYVVYIAMDHVNRKLFKIFF